MPIVDKFFLLLISLTPLFLSAQTQTLVAPIVGVDNKALLYGVDYEVSLIADGKLLNWSDYEVIPTVQNELKIQLLEKHKIASIKLLIEGQNYYPFSRNLFVGKGAGESVILRQIKPKARPLMVTGMRYFRTYEDGDGLINFEVTFRNNSGEEVLLNHLRVDAGIEQACGAPDPTFATISFNNEVKFFTQRDTSNLLGMASESLDHLGRITGSVNYQACGSRTVDLQMPLSTIVPPSKYSKMIIQIPDDLRFYEHHTMDPMERGVTIDYKVKYAKRDVVENMFSIFQDIPDIGFTFTAVADEQWELQALINEIEF